MPLASGSLADEIGTDRTLGGDPRKPLFDILAGLEAVHDGGFSHRDLKPANVPKVHSFRWQRSVQDLGLWTHYTWCRTNYDTNCVQHGGWHSSLSRA